MAVPAAAEEATAAGLGWVGAAEVEEAEVEVAIAEWVTSEAEAATEAAAAVGGPTAAREARAAR